MRDATLIADSQQIHISAENQHENAFIHQIEFPGIGKLEAIPNGNAAYYANLLKLGASLQESGRYSLRWPGWSAVLNPLKQLGFLSEAPIHGLSDDISALEFTAKLLAQELQYKDSEKDLCVMVNTVEGERKGSHERMTCSLLIERDLTTGLMGMSMGVAYPACIAAEMIVNAKIQKKGILSPATDIPPDLFISELRTRGIKIKDTFERLA
jgi:saccharopine dehydrogenase-like NADP-dependent oxidoreductase